MGLDLHKRAASALPAPLAILLTILLTAWLTAALPVLADAREDEIFRAADQAREQAEALEASMLAPGSYGDGIAALERARRDYRGGAEIGAVESRAARATQSFQLAAQNARQAGLTLRDTLEKRDAARAADAFRLAGSDWIKAEEQLRAAAQKLEKTDVTGSLARAEKASALYDQAELLAIKAGLLTEARRLVLELDEQNTRKLAPKTTARAQQLLQQADAELSADRSRRDAATRLAAEAADEARHAIAINRMLLAAREQDATSEDLVLRGEAGLRQAAAAAGARLDLSAGPEKAAAALADDVAALRQDLEQKTAELRQRDRQVAALEEEMRDLDSRLAGASKTTRSLTERLAVRERASEQFERLEALFPPEQALVLRQGDDIIVRVHGLGFPSGSARLPSSATALLEKIRDTTALYPGAVFSIEGHTDSTGDGGANQRLSQARAEAVRDYLLGQSQSGQARITAIGYGDTRPIAKNETSEGRSQNRRIDLVITPIEGSRP